MTARATVRAEVGGREAEVSLAGLAPGLACVNQVNFRVPEGVTGRASLRIGAAGATSNAVSLAVR